jgi:hypothetical protein
MRFRKRKAAGPAPAVAAAVLTERPIPAGSLIATRTGKLAHIKSGQVGVPGSVCDDLRKFTDWLYPAPSSLPLCPRCARAAGLSEGKAS